MADITMCDGTNCPINKECYRHTAPPTQHWQAYFQYIPYDVNTKECEWFIENSEYKRKQHESSFAF